MVGPTKIDLDWLRRRVAEGALTAEIAKEAGVSRSGVRRALKRIGITRPQWAPVDVERLVADYRAGRPVEEIAAQVGRSVGWVYQTAAAAGAGRRRQAPSRIAFNQRNANQPACCGGKPRGGLRRV